VSRAGVGRAVLAATLAAAAGVAAACDREDRSMRQPPAFGARPTGTRQSPLQPGGAGRTGGGTRSAGGSPFHDNAWHVAEGKRLFSAFNCVGCHANGGGGMGPPLMDSTWIYGDSPEQIFATIVEGRPNGMPSFGGKVPEMQVWQLIAYIESLNGRLAKDVAPGRTDHMSVKPPEMSLPEMPSRPAKREPQP
jgi:cytochrome c oxidase cbb3-type subunit 3